MDQDQVVIFIAIFKEMINIFVKVQDGNFLLKLLFVVGMADQTYSVPVQQFQPGFQPGYQPGFQPYPTQPIATAPPINYGAIPQQNFPQPMAYTTSSATHLVIEPNNIIIVGGCPVCRIGVLEDNFTCGGLLCALLFFPLGILCCLAMRTKVCSNCHIEM